MDNQRYLLNISHAHGHRLHTQLQAVEDVFLQMNLLLAHTDGVPVEVLWGVQGEAGGNNRKY